MSRTFHIQTFGCQMNVGDSAWLGRALSARGLAEAPDERADVVLVNTCSVRDKPEQKVYSLLGRLERRMRPGSFVAVGGCVAQQVGAELFRRFPTVRLVFGTDAVAMVPDAVERLLDEPAATESLLEFSPGWIDRPRDYPGGVEPCSFVTIMQGCDNFCAYCIVPHVRGRQKSRVSADVLAECEELVSRGAREITLLGQNVNSYGLDSAGDGTSFASLLERVANIPGLARLRFTTSHPKDIAPEVIRAFGELENLCPHLHLPLQSGSDAVLKKMGRKYTRAQYLAIVRRLREVRPDISLTTDLIVGFPGESEADFEATLEIMDEVGFEGSFSFIYSDRPGVAAARMKSKVPADVAGQRLERLQARQNERTARVLQSLAGTEAEVLFERPSPRQDGGAVYWTGRDPARRVVNVPVEGGANLAGRLARVRIESARKHSLRGKVAGEPC